MNNFEFRLKDKNKRRHWVAFIYAINEFPVDDKSTGDGCVLKSMNEGKEDYFIFSVPDSKLTDFDKLAKEFSATMMITKLAEEVIL